MKKQLFKDTLKILKKVIIVKTISLIFSDGIKFIFAIMLGKMTNEVINLQMPTIVEMVSFIILMILAFGLEPLLTFYSNKIFLKQANEGDVYLLDNVLDQSPKVINNYKVGELSNKITDDNTEYRWAIIDLYTYSIETVLMLTMIIIVIGKVSVSYLMFVFAIALVNCFKSLFKAALDAKYLGLKLQADEVMNDQIYNSLEGKECIRFDNLLSPLFNKLKNTSDKLQKTTYEKKAAVDNNLENLDYLLSNLSYLVIIMFGIHLVIVEEVPLGLVLSMTFIFSLVTSLFTNMDKVFKAAKVFKTMGSEIETFIQEPVKNISGDFESMAIKDLKYSYTDTESLSYPDLRIEKGDKVLIKGKNGSGKSTLLKLVCGILEKETGELKLNGHDYELGKIRNLVAYSDSHLTLKDTVGNYLKNNCVGQDQKLYSEFRIYELSTKDIGTLSGGEKARMEIYRVLNSGKKIVILDEPEAYLDLRQKKLVIDSLLNYHGTVIIASHDPLFLQDFQKIVEL